MSILNRESEGLPSILITITALLIREKAMSRDDLLMICFPDSLSDRDNDKASSRFRGTLNRWITLGLFEVVEDKVRLAFEPKRGEDPLAFLNRLPNICRRLPLNSALGNPLWPVDARVSEEGSGLTADFCRGLSWCLSQDVYNLSTSWVELEKTIIEQMKPGRFIFLNDTRWAGLRDWARFFGFASGDDSSIFFDPTQAIRFEIAGFMKRGDSLPAAEFISRLANLLPVLDGGAYRTEVEDALRTEKWASPPPGHLSTSLSFAMRRLQKQGLIGLSTLADAESKCTLVGQQGRIWESFTHVSLIKEMM
jgi:hypothetical protein